MKENSEKTRFNYYLYENMRKIYIYIFFFYVLRFNKVNEVE
jgi:hypothetical protein